MQLRVPLGKQPTRITDKVVSHQWEVGQLVVVPPAEPVRDHLDAMPKQEYHPQNAEVALEATCLVVSEEI